MIKVEKENQVYRIDQSELEFYKEKGFEVVESLEDEDDFTHGDEDVDLMTMDVEELKAYAAEKGIHIGEATSKNGILKKIKDFQEQREG